LFRWIAGILGFLVAPVFGLFVGVISAFGYTYVFLDEDRTGNADVATNISFLAIAIVLGMIGIIVGLIGGRKLLVCAFGKKTRGSLMSDTHPVGSW
jgi:hypothetical protein